MTGIRSSSFGSAGAILPARAGGAAVAAITPTNINGRHDMQGNSGTPADLVAVFDTQGAAEEAVYRLRLAGFGDDRMACYSRTPGLGLLDTFNRDYAFAGAAIG